MILPTKQHRKMGAFSNFFGGGGQQGGGTPAGGGIAHNAAGANVTVLPRTNGAENVNSPNGGTNVSAPAAPAPPPNPIDSQLAGLEKLWSNPTTADGKPIPQQVDPLAAPLFQFDPAKITQEVGKLDFTSSISSEDLQSAMTDPAVFKKLLNQVAQQSFAMATLNTGNLLNDGFTRHGRNIDAALPTRFRNLQVSQAKSEDPVLSHPSMKPMVGAIRGMLASKLPHASADEINQATEEFFGRVTNALVAGREQTEAKNNGSAEAETDWLSLMGLDSK